jgi:hypothetical protein
MLGMNVYIFSKLWCAMSMGKVMPTAQMKWHLDAQIFLKVTSLRQTNEV